MRTTQKLTEIVDEWIANTDVLQTTKADYRRKINLWFRWLSAHDVDPRHPEHRHVLEYKQDLQAQGKSIFTVASYVTIVKLFYGFCYSRRYYDRIGQGVKSSFKQREHCKAALSQKDASRLIDSIPTDTMVGKRDKLMITLMLTNGLRTCEVHRIDIGDFDKKYNRSVIHIQRKGRSFKQDTVAVPRIVDDLFVDYIADRDFQADDPLFVNHARGGTGDRLAKTTISAIVKKRLRSIGIDRPDVSAHSLRHTCGCLMVDMGVDLETIKDMLGHTDTSTTRIYVNMAQQRRILEQSPAVQIAGLITKPAKKTRSIR